MQRYVSFKKSIVKISLYLKTVFRLNIFTLQAFFYVLDDGLKKVDCKFSISLEKQNYKDSLKQNYKHCFKIFTAK